RATCSLCFIADCCAKASDRERRLLHHPSVFNALAATSALTIAPMTKGCSCTRPRRDVLRPQNAKPIAFHGTKESTLRNPPMHPLRVLQLCALPIPVTLALILLLGPACAQAPEQAKDETPVELPTDEPLDLSTPEPDADTLKAPTPFAVKPSAPDWNGKAGIDYSKPSIPAVTFQPDQLLAGAVPDQSSGVAWATITAPGFEAPLGWDKTSIETRVDPSHEQGKLGTTLSRSVP